MVARAWSAASSRVSASISAETRIRGMISETRVLFSGPPAQFYPTASQTSPRSPSSFSQSLSLPLNFKFNRRFPALESESTCCKSSLSFSVSPCSDLHPRKCAVENLYRGDLRVDLCVQSKIISRQSFNASFAAQRWNGPVPFCEGDEDALKSRSLRAGKGRGRICRTLRSMDEGFSRMSFDHDPVLLKTRRVGSYSEGVSQNTELSQTEQAVSRETLKVSPGVEEKIEDVSQQKRTAFEQWAMNKLREDGLSSLPVIEEMRQTFAPGSQPLDPRALMNEAGFRESGSREIAKLIPKGDSNFPEPKITRRNVTARLFSSTSTVERLPLDEELPSRGSGERRRTAKLTQNTTKDNLASPPLPKPLLVKRSTTLPDDWNGTLGTVVLIDKPQGWTSFAVCGKLRHTLKIQKVGHAGTLDPMATGLLIVCLGKATKLADSYQAMNKVYSGTFRLGELTPSLDADTEVSDILPWEHIEDHDLETAKQAFIGDILQRPPMFSAVKIKGERLYAKARRGEEIDVPARPVTVQEFTLRRCPNDRQNIHFKVTCSKGTYIRSLCSDLGRALGSYAHLTALRREKIGSYSVSDAWTVQDLVGTYNQQRVDFPSTREV